MHSITFLVGQSSEKYYKEGLGFNVEEKVRGKILVGNNPYFVDDWYFDSDKHDKLSTRHKYASVNDWTAASYFTRLNYSYAGKYMFTGTLRKDGSSKFGKDSKWGLFPGVSLGWVVSEESFFNINMVDQLKFRASWGSVGNGNIPSYLSQSLITTKPIVYIGVIPEGPSKSIAWLPDPTLQWESTNMVDVGFDAFLINRISVTSDIYWKTTYNLIWEKRLPMSTGFEKIEATNLGSIEQFGFELAISGDVIQSRTDGFNWNATLTMDHLHGKIVDLPAETPYVSSGDIRSYVGAEIGQIYGYIVDGIYTSDEELNDPANPNPSAQIGDYKYRDIARVDEFGDIAYVPDTNITSADLVNLGSVTPKVSFGFNNTFTYKRFDLNLFFRAAVGNKIYNKSRRELLNTDGELNLMKEAVNRYPYSNQLIQGARSNRVDPSNGAALDIFVEDGSYLRLSNLTLGYNLGSLINRLDIQSLRLYGSINNVFVLTKYSGLDPDTGAGIDKGPKLVPRGVDENLYPTVRTYSLGLQVTF
ncbi:MAG: hypothetical protein HC896_13120 [Bacteroidales bacterium]|nr:hypothetical protein [Bacteroidales bacterium]